MLKGQIFVSVSDNKSVPLVPGPPGVWHAASDVATKTQLQTKEKGLNTINAGGELGIESSPMWLGQSSCRCIDNHKIK